MHDAENIAPNVQPSFTKNLVSTCACTRMHACPQRPRALRHISSFPRVQKAKKDTVVPDFKEHCESEERKQHEVHAHNVHARTTNPKMNLSDAKGWGDWPHLVARLPKLALPTLLAGRRSVRPLSPCVRPFARTSARLSVHLPLRVLQAHHRPDQLLSDETQVRIETSDDAGLVHAHELGLFLAPFRRMPTANAERRGLDRTGGCGRKVPAKCVSEISKNNDTSNNAGQALGLGSADRVQAQQTGFRLNGPDSDSVDWV